MFDCNSLRVLLVLGSDRDTQATTATLALSGVVSLNCASTSELCGELKKGAGALLLGTDVLTEDRFFELVATLEEQPGWSHLPILILLSNSDLVAVDHPGLIELERLGNVTLLEGPVRMGTLVSSVRASVAYRQRQYQQRDLLHQLEASRREAVEANRAKSDFLANMSHEIRTPLGAVMGFSELLMDRSTSEREKQVYMTAIRRNGQLLSALIDDILDLAKVESGRIELDQLEFSLTEMMSEVINALEPLAARKRLALNVERAPGTPDAVRGDLIRIKQILMNIVGNAIKFTSVGHVIVRLSGRTCKEAAHAFELVFEVEDSGIGISNTQKARLFQPFTQADTSTTRRFGGTGLGLVLSRKLAQALGGELALRWSVPGGGSSFVIQIPVEPVASPTLVIKEEPFAVEGGPLSGVRVLVVDDSLDNQMLIGRTLKILGAQIDLASDGLEAVQMALNVGYDVVLMDLQMPRLSGVEATRILREKGYRQPIVALTAHALKEDRVNCLKVGCTDYLTKPVQRAHLVRVLEKVAKVPSGAMKLPLEPRALPHVEAPRL